MGSQNVADEILGSAFVEHGTAVVLRPKRQVTLPKKICDQMGIEPGDVLEMVVKESAIIVRPRKTVALKALSQIREAFQRSGITEEELRQAGHSLRHKVAKKH